MWPPRSDTLPVPRMAHSRHGDWAGVRSTTGHRRAQVEKREQRGPRDSHQPWVMDGPQPVLCLGHQPPQHPCSPGPYKVLWVQHQDSSFLRNPNLWSRWWTCRDRGGGDRTLSTCTFCAHKIYHNAIHFVEKPFRFESKIPYLSS